MSVRTTGIVLLTLAVAGCASVKRMPPPEERAALAQIPGMPDVRFWGDDAPPDHVERRAIIRAQIQSAPGYDQHMPVHFLALSGGGQNGAFGAGLLAGWSETGQRPQFRMVTGISTGSLIAPFAFLGPEYDRVIQEMYTQFSTKDVLKKRLVAGFNAGDSVSDHAPLRNIIKSYLTEKEVELIAVEHALGRRLFVGTTHLDMQRPVIWDLGAIASSGHPNARDLILDVLLASAAIPGAFPPVYFEVEHGDETYDELHVDGGVTTQVFISPVAFKMEQALHDAGLHGQAHIYLIRNSQLAPEIAHVKPKTVPILTQSLSTLLRAQGLGDMYRIYQDALLNNMEYNSAHIPDDFRAEPDEPFDIDYMTELFMLGYEKAKRGYPWDKQPPEFQHMSTRGPQ